MKNVKAMMTDHTSQSFLDVKVAKQLLALLGCWFADNDPPIIIDDADWPSIIKVAIESKTAGLLLEVIKSNEFEVPGDVRLGFKNLHSNLLKAGLFNLGWTIKVGSLLNSAGIRNIAFKGAIQAYSAYGSWDKRRSADIDILVERADFAKAAETLTLNGYPPVFNASSKWWMEHLGESPFKRDDGSDVVVDLHNRIQQPGGPFPSNMDRFFSDSELKPFGADELRVFSYEHSILITAICYGKAVRAGTPWIHYAHELLVVHKDKPASWHKSVEDLAEFHDLRRLYDEAMLNARELFLRSDDMIRAAGPGAEVYDQLLMSSLGSVEYARFYRTRKLWDWLDGSPPKRASRLFDGLLRVVKSDWTQKMEERKGILPKTME